MFFKDIYYYGKIRPVMAEDGWNNEAGIDDSGKLYIAPDNLLPDPLRTHDILAVFNGEWTSSAVIYNMYSVQRTRLLNLFGSIRSAKEDINELEEIL